LYGIPSSVLALCVLLLVGASLAIAATVGATDASSQTVATTGSLIVGIDAPQAGQQLHTDRDFLIVGHALDTSTSLDQGIQGSGIDRVQVFMDIPPNATPMADAELGFSNASAALVGSQFANSGFRLRFHPGDFRAGSHNLYVVAHSAVTGQQLVLVFWISITTEPTGGRRNAFAATSGGGGGGGNGGGATPTPTSQPGTAPTVASPTPTASGNGSGGAPTPTNQSTSTPTSPASTATSTSTPPAMASPTSTPTPPATASPTSTPTPIATSTPTSTPTITTTPTATQTPTNTPTPTSTPTLTPTATATSTPTSTPVATPLAVADGPVQVLGNVEVTQAAPGVLANDTLNGGSITALNGVAGSLPLTGTSSNGGNVTLRADGSFDFNPKAGFDGSDSFTYTLSNSAGSSTATVSLTVSGMIWFVDNSQTSNGDGRLTSPFNCLSGSGCLSGAPTAAGNTVFLYRQTASSYTGNVTLLANQHLVGQGASLSLSSISGLTPPTGSLPLPSTGGTNPVIVTTTAATDTIDLGTNNTVDGLTVGNKTGVGIHGSAFGSLTVRDVSINGTGQALGLTTGTVTATFADLSSSSGSNNISLTSIAGSLTATSGALSGSTGVSFFVSAGTANITYNGSISTTSTSGAVTVQGRTGGSIGLEGGITSSGPLVVQNNTAGSTSFDGASKVVSTGSGVGVNLASNTGHMIQFTNGGLSVTTTTGTAFSATGGGMVGVTGAGNTLTTTTGTALVVTSTTIGGGGMTFLSITAGTSASGPANAIALTSTGTSGGLTVTGDGLTAGSGGTIQHTSSDSVSLDTTANVVLQWMNINNSAANGISGLSVNGFVLDHASMNSNGTATQQGAIRFGDETNNALNGLVGTAGGSNPTRISNSTLNASFERNVSIFNTGGTLAELDVQSSTIENAKNGSGFLIETRVSGSATVSVSGGTLASNFATGMQGSALAGTTMSLIISGATFTSNNAGVLCSNDGNASAACTISNSTFTGHLGNSIFVGNGTTLSTAGALNARIQDNTITQPVNGNNASIGVFLSGSGTVSNVLIDGNKITNNGDFDGLNVNTPDSGSTPTIGVTITNNTVATTTAGPNGANAIDLTPHQSATACFNVTGNTASTASALDAILLSQGGSAAVTLEKGGSTSTNAQTVLQNNNPLSTQSTIQVFGTVTVVSNGSCATPP
jgi:hypothetical protein